MWEVRRKEVMKEINVYVSVKLYKSMVRSHLEYAVCVWYPLQAQRYRGS